VQTVKCLDGRNYRLNDSVQSIGTRKEDR